MISDDNYLSYIIRERRTVHAFTPEKVDDSLVHAAAGVARWAPNHKLTEPWRIILIGDSTAGRIVELNTRLVRQKRGDKTAEIKHARWSAVPNWLAVTSEIAGDEVRTRENYAATCCFIQNLMLYLWSKNVGTKWTTGAVTRYDDIYQVLDLDPERVEIAGLIWYGYADEVKVTRRRSVDEIVSRKE